METITYLRGNDHSDPVELPPGVHTFNAVCILPTHLPTSFEGSVGHIRYFAKVVIDRPWKFDHSFKRAFTVIRQYDLNCPRCVSRWNCIACTHYAASRAGLVHSSGPLSCPSADLRLVRKYPFTWTW